MYLSNKQHSQLRTVVMNFEVPFRAYIAKTILDDCSTADEFKNKIDSKINLCTQYVGINSFASEFGKIKASPEKTYQLLTNVKDSIGHLVQVQDINVPNVSKVITLILTFSELFANYINRFFDINSFWAKASKFHYVRNKLSHPACKTLEKLDMDLTVEFIQVSNNFLRQNEPSFYWLESPENIEKQLDSLLSSSFSIPVPTNNFHEMPFAESKLVCREKEIHDLKSFVYGKPGALRKKSSYCLFGYGGVGKTALVLEAIKSIVQDLIDETALNNYKPDFILFFTAKKVELEISMTSGEIEQHSIKNTFSNFETLRTNIFSYLKIKDFSQFNKQGLIVIDNFETIPQEEREKICEFIEYDSPDKIQYIITSRNEEKFSERKCLSGFNDKASCNNFITEYIEENNLNLQLSSPEIDELLEITRGTHIGFSFKH